MNKILNILFLGDIYNSIDRYYFLKKNTLIDDLDMNLVLLRLIKNGDIKILKIRALSLLFLLKSKGITPNNFDKITLNKDNTFFYPQLKYLDKNLADFFNTYHTLIHQNISLNITSDFYKDIILHPNFDLSPYYNLPAFNLNDEKSIHQAIEFLKRNSLYFWFRCKTNVGIEKILEKNF